MTDPQRRWLKRSLPGHLRMLAYCHEKYHDDDARLAFLTAGVVRDLLTVHGDTLAGRAADRDGVIEAQACATC